MAPDQKAKKTIQRTASFFILISVFAIVVGLIPAIRNWLQGLLSAALYDSIFSLAAPLSRLRFYYIYNIALLINGLVLFRHCSRIAAILFLLEGLELFRWAVFLLWSEGLGWTGLAFGILWGIFTLCYSLLGAFALTAAIEFHTRHLDSAANHSVTCT